MKKLKLDLIKQSSIRLTSDEASSVQGGGKIRSDRKFGDCKYSRNHPDLCGGDENTLCGCTPLL